MTGNPERGWQLEITYFDSAGNRQAVQTHRTGRGTLALVMQTVKAKSDSAALVISDAGVTGWVVPAGAPARLIYANRIEPRYAPDIVEQAFAAMHLKPGEFVVLRPTSLYSSDPLGGMRIHSAPTGMKMSPTMAPSEGQSC